MKWKIILIVAILLLILAQALFGPKSESAVADAAPETDEVAAGGADVADVTDAGGGDAPSGTPPPAPEDVRGIIIGDGGDAIRLHRDESGWFLPDLDAPADSDMVRRLLRSLLAGDRRPVLPGDPGKTGLEDGGGLPVSLELDNGGNYDVLVGLRPRGVYDAAFLRLPDGGVNLVSGDIRGALGLWRNSPDAKPENAVWLEKRALAFEPSRAVRVEATFPDHQAVFEKSPEGVWQPAGYVPGDDWSSDGFAAWLGELSDFRIADVVPDGEFPDDAADGVLRIGVTLDDGGTRSVSALPNHAGEGMLATTSEYPGRVFHVSEWRANRYFRLLPLLFPGAAPAFDVSDIRFIDVRRGGAAVKIARRDGDWEAVALPYPPKTAAVERLARLLASWRPEDYAAPDFKRIRPGFGGPMLEVILEDGTVHQYRLAGRHPLFPWRYVTLDGVLIFSVTDAEAGVMFPGLADILDLGRVFRDVNPEDVDAAALSGADGEPLAAFNREPEGIWSVLADGRKTALMPDEYERILGGLLRLRVTGFYDVDRRQGGISPQCHVQLSGRDGLDARAVFLQPEGRDIPFMIDGNRGYLVDRADFQNWLAAVRGAERRAREEAAREAEAVHEAEATAEAPVADDGAVPEVPPGADAEETPEASVPPDAEEPGEAGGDPVPAEEPELPAPETAAEDVSASSVQPDAEEQPGEAAGDSVSDEE